MLETNHTRVMRLWNEINAVLDRIKDPFTPEQMEYVRLVNVMLAALSAYVTDEEWYKALDDARKTVSK